MVTSSNLTSVLLVIDNFEYHSSTNTFIIKSIQQIYSQLCKYNTKQKYCPSLPSKPQKFSSNCFNRNRNLRLYIPAYCLREWDTSCSTGGYSSRNNK